MQDELALFNKLAKILIETEKTNPVAQPILPSKLFKALDLSLAENPISESDLEKILVQLIESTPKTASNLFFNQLFGGRNAKATLGDLLAVLLNNSMYTYKVAGPMVGVEKEILHKICHIIGYEKSGDGTFAPGGSMSNFMAMLMARDAKNPKIKKNGISEKLTLYTSVESHYSIPKNAAFIGVGRENVRYIDCDSVGKMKPDKLNKAIEQDLEKGYTPFFVNATAGTTVLGAFDDIKTLSKICKKYKLWLHVDGAYCGGVIFSEKYKHLVSGLELSDSFSVNAHKMLGTPLTCSIIVAKNKKHFFESFSNDAAYLYQTDGDDYNLGKTSIQCGRRNDALKFWMLWKSVGSKGLETIVNKQFELADTARNYIKDNPDYQLYSFDNSISICFNYKNIPAQQLCTKLYKKAKLMIGFGTFNNVQFVRLVTINSGNSNSDILNFFNVIENFVASHPNLKQPEVFQQ